MASQLASGHTIVGRYRLLRPIGRGGSGNVWLAQDLLRDRRPVAFKVASVPQDEVTAESLRQEFRVLTQLLHPHLVRVFDTGMLPTGGRFLTEEFVDGETLWSLAGALAGDCIEAVFVQLLRALDYLDRRRVIHGDIQPANAILQWRIGPDGAQSPLVKLVDFGLAHGLDGSPRSLTGGTHAFMAPEVRLAHAPDTLSELFSVAATIYAAVTGAAPFPSRLTPREFLEQGPAEFNGFAADVPDAVRAVLRRMLAVSREARYQTPRDALDDLVYRSGGRISIASLDVAPSYLHGGALVGRAELFGELERRHAAGRCRVVLVGPAGLGKSRIARELQVHAQLDGAPAFQLRVGPSNVPYAAAAQLAGQIASHAGEAEVGVLDIERRRAGGVTGVRHSFAPSLLAALRCVGGFTPRPVVIVEDIDLADEWSLAILQQWAAGDADFTFVATAQRLPAALGAVVDVLSVSPLTRAEVLHFLEDRFGEVDIEPNDVDLLVDASGGAPGRLRELCADLLDRGMLTCAAGDQRWTLRVPDDGLTHDVAVDNRLGGLSPMARRVLAFLSLLQRPIDDSLLLDLLGHDGGTGPQPMELWDLLRDLDRRAFISLDREEALLVIRPPGERVQSALRAELTTAAQRALHAEIGAALADRWTARGDVEAREVAFHLHRAGLHDAARNFEFIAANDAIGVGAIERALEHLDWAVRGSIGREEEAYVRLREVLQARRVGDILRAEDSCREAVELADGGYVGALAQVFLVQSALERGELTLARSAYQYLTGQWPDLSRTYLVEKARAEVARAIGRLDESLAAHERCVELAASRGWGVGAFAAELQVGSVLLGLGEVEAGDHHYERLLTGSGLRETLGAGRHGIALAEWGKIALISGDIDTARARLDLAYGIVRDTRAARRIAEVILYRVEFELATGDPESAAQWLGALQPLRPELYARALGGAERGFRFLVDAHHPALAPRAVMGLEQAAARPGGVEARATALFHLGWGCAIAGDHDGARRVWQTLMEYVESLPFGTHVTAVQVQGMLARMA